MKKKISVLIVIFLIMISLTAKTNGDDIDLSWNAVPGADQYYIYRSSQVDINYNFIGATATEFYSDQNAGLENKYFYKIKTYFSDQNWDLLGLKN